MFEGLLFSCGHIRAEFLKPCEFLGGFIIPVLNYLIRIHPGKPFKIGIGIGGFFGNVHALLLEEVTVGFGKFPNPGGARSRFKGSHKFFVTTIFLANLGFGSGDSSLHHCVHFVLSVRLLCRRFFCGLHRIFSSHFFGHKGFLLFHRELLLPTFYGACSPVSICF